MPSSVNVSLSKGCRVGIIQSSYIPWRGYFDMIERCDVFVFLDSVQFTRRDWRTRNAIKTPNGSSWLSIPVKQKGNFHASIDSVVISDPSWAATHLRSIQGAYRRAEAYDAVYPVLADAFAAIAHQNSLSTVNQHLTRALCEALEIKTPLLVDVDLIARASLDTADSTQRLIDLAKAAGGTSYLSGPSAHSYLDERRFQDAGLKVEWMDYANSLIPYRQLWGDFVPAVSIIDPLLNLGFEATRATLRDRSYAA